MPTCESCKKTFSDRRHFYCDACRCTQSNCEGLRSGGPKCRTHQGLCLTKDCPGKISPGQRYCSTCQTSRNAKSAAQLAPKVKPGDNFARRNAVYATALKDLKTNREHIAEVLRAVQAIARTRRFNKILDDLVGWKNLKSWARWAGRAMEPAILKRDRMSSIVTVFETELNAASVRRAHFAERFLEEILLICNAEIERTDISYMVGMAFMVFGPLMAPLSAAAGAAASATSSGTSALARGMATKGAISLGKTLAEMGVNSGAKSAVVGSSFSSGMSSTSSTAATGIASVVDDTEDWDNIPTRGRSHAVTSRPSDLATTKELYHYSVNPLQYAVSLFEYLSEKNSFDKNEQLVVDEFGGLSKVRYLYETLENGAEYP